MKKQIVETEFCISPTDLMNRLNGWINRGFTIHSVTRVSDFDKRWGNGAATFLVILEQGT